VATPITSSSWEIPRADILPRSSHSIMRHAEGLARIPTRARERWVCRDLRLVPRTDTERAQFPGSLHGGRLAWRFDLSSAPLAAHAAPCMEPTTRRLPQEAVHHAKECALPPELTFSSRRGSIDRRKCRCARPGFAGKAADEIVSCVTRAGPRFLPVHQYSQRNALSNVCATRVDFR